MTLAGFLQRISRAARWHRRGLGIIACVVCFFATLSALSPDQPDSAPVVVATRALPAGTQLGADDLAVVLMPLAHLPDAAVSDPAEALGRTLVGPLTSGSVLTSANLLGSRDAELGADERLVPFRVPDAATVALLRVGDRISVVGSTVDGGVVDLATDVRVAALPAPAESGSFGAGDSGALVVVACDSATAGRLAAASSQMRMAIVMR